MVPPVSATLRTTEIIHYYLVFFIGCSIDDSNMVIGTSREYIILDLCPTLSLHQYALTTSSFDHGVIWWGYSAEFHRWPTAPFQILCKWLCSMLSCTAVQCFRLHLLRCLVALLWLASCNNFSGAEMVPRCQQTSRCHYVDTGTVTH